MGASNHDYGSFLLTQGILPVSHRQMAHYPAVAFTCQELNKKTGSNKVRGFMRDSRKERCTTQAAEHQWTGDYLPIFCAYWKIIPSPIRASALESSDEDGTCGVGGIQQRILV